MYREEKVEAKNTECVPCGPDKDYLKKRIKDCKEALNMIIYLKDNDFINWEDSDKAIGRTTHELYRLKKDLKSSKKAGKK